MTIYLRYGKRIFDFVVAALALVLLLPVWLLVTLLVRWRLGTPILFRQQRPGRFGRPFTILKFRTMTNERNEKGELLPDHARLTRLGRFLRSASLDELPELLNVLKGEMSLVGPRPLLMHYLELYTPEQMRRHELRPGITGWAQINGRNALSWEDKFAFDGWYVDHCSFGLDVKILLLTGLQILRRDGINHPGQATMKPFTGSTPN